VKSPDELIASKQISEIKFEFDVIDSLNELMSLGLITMKIDNDGNQVFRIVQKYRKSLESLVS